MLLTMYEMSGGEIRSLRFEDIVVSAFKKYPDDFHLRGYKEFPDSGDLVHKPLYDFRKSGLVEAGNKVFTLTSRGLSTVEALIKKLDGREVKREGRLSAFAEKEIIRIEGLESLELFLNDEKDKILDMDFFAFLGVTVRTPKNDFMGRLNTVRDALKELEKAENISPLRAKVSSFAKFMFDKFDTVVNQKSE